MANQFCSNCGAAITATDGFCESCGTKIVTQFSQQAPVYQAPQGPPYQQPSQGTDPSKNKNPTIALILSFFICGVGQMYNGQVPKGLMLLVGFIISYVLSMLFFPIYILLLIIWIYGVYDAYTTANKINNGEAV